MTGQVDVSVVLPVYDNADTLPPLCDRLVATLESCATSYELIAVDDASPDASAQVLDRLRDSHPTLRVLSHRSNLGQQRATIAGLRAARGTHIVTLDADLQDLPEAIPELLGRLRVDAVDAVFASRTGNYQSRGRLVTGAAFKWLVRKLTGLPYGAGSYVAMSRHMVDAVLSLDGDPYLVGMIGCTGLPVGAVPVERVARPSGRSSYNAAMRLRMGVTAIRQIMRWRRAMTPGRRTAHNAVQQHHYRGHGLASPRMQPVRSPYVERHVDRLLSSLSLPSGARILDVGCGLGKFTLPLLDRGYAVEGLDLSTELLAELRRMVPDEERLPLHEADLLAPPPHLLGCFDAVVGFFMLHHLLDLNAAFDSVGDLLRPGGSAAFLEPNAYNPLYWLQITFTPGMNWATERGVLRMRHRLLQRSLARAGFAEVEVRRTGMFPPVVTNRRAGRALEDLLDAARVFQPVSAFQVIHGRRLPLT